MRDVRAHGGALRRPRVDHQAHHRCVDRRVHGAGQPPQGGCQRGKQVRGPRRAVRAAERRGQGHRGRHGSEGRDVPKRLVVHPRRLPHAARLLHHKLAGAPAAPPLRCGPDQRLQPLGQRPPRAPELGQGRREAGSPLVQQRRLHERRHTPEGDLQPAPDERGAHGP